MKDLLQPFQRQQLEAAYRIVSDKRTANKLNSLLLLDDGFSYEEVSAILKLDDATIRRYENSFRQIGLDEFLKSPYEGGKCKLSEAQLATLEKFVSDTFCQSSKVVIEYCEMNFGVSYTNAGMSFLLRRLGFVYKAQKKVPAKVDPERQEAFVEYYNKIRASMTVDDKMYFIDGVHPQHNSQPECGWIKKGTEKQIESNTGRKRVNINGALDIETKEVIALSCDSINAQSTIKLLKMLEDNNPAARKIVVVVDNALYYYNAEVLGYAQDSEKLELVFLPPYCPNLNLIERLWGFMKRKVVYGKYYKTFEEFKDAIGHFFQHLPLYADELEDLISENFQMIIPNQ